ncbi:MAG: hypothetical protein Q7S40_18255, partial [Opitutaceae bacterium]|nr:hypothetical protein [Opitutaceae bacterium]
TVDKRVGEPFDKLKAIISIKQLALSPSNGQRAPPFSEFETGAGTHFDCMDAAKNELMIEAGLRAGC